MHNEYDALENFKKAELAFNSRANKKLATTPNNEQTLFGENSATAIVLISATTKKIGIIVHCNEEIE